MQLSIPNQISFNAEEKLIIQSEIDKFIKKGIIEEAYDTNHQYISNIFTRPKKDGSYRVILNLKHLNCDIEHHHFKMETFRTTIPCVTPDCWFASVDLKDAYYSVNVNKKDRQYLKFYWNNTLYQFTCLPNGLTTAPRVFTKLLKVVFAQLRKIGHTNVAYIDDSLLVSRTFSECKTNIQDTVQLLDSLGFTIHPDKSVLEPTQTIKFVGFIINSQSMCVKLTLEKAKNIKEFCETLIRKLVISIRDFAKAIGMFVAAEPAVEYAPLYYKSLEIDKDKHLKENCGNFDAKMKLSDENIVNLKWWIDNIEISFKPLIRNEPDLVLKTDSSRIGWGGLIDNTIYQTKGFWSYEEQKFHINYLELKAAFLTLKYFCSSKSNIHVRIFMDNMVAINYIEKMGGRIENLNKLVKEILVWCKNRHIWISACHLPGKENVEADRLSRSLNMDIEWKLDEKVFKTINELYGPHDIDLFASKTNHQLARYISYLPDSCAECVDAFSVKWTNFNAYVFPPFSIIGRVLQKMKRDEADITLIAPLWTTQTWFPEILHCIAKDSFIIPKQKHLLYQPTQPQQKHPLVKMTLAVFRLSGQFCKVMDFQKTLQKSSCPHGEDLHKNSIGHISENGCHFVVKNRLIYLKPLKSKY